MAIDLRHTTVAVGTNAGNGEIAKEEWNEAHTLTMSSGFVMGRTDPGTGSAQEVSYAALAAAGGYATLTGTETLTNKTLPSFLLDANVGFETPSSGRVKINDGGAGYGDIASLAFLVSGGSQGLFDQNRIHLKNTQEIAWSTDATAFNAKDLAIVRTAASLGKVTDGGAGYGDLEVKDEAYGIGWSTSREVPTKNALYNKIETIGGGGSSPLTTKGDIYIHDDTSDARLPVGADGQVLAADSVATNGLKWIPLTGGGDMSTGTYDPAAVAEQLLGLTATQTFTNKTAGGNLPVLGQVQLGASSDAGIGREAAGEAVITNGSTGLGRLRIAEPTEVDQATTVTFVSNNYEAIDAAIMRSDTSSTLTAGMAHTAFNAGAKNSGTWVPDPANGNKQYITTAGGFTLDPPTSDCDIEVHVTVQTGAGSITFTNWTLADGDSMTTNNGDQFVWYINTINTVSHLTITQVV